MLPVTSEADNSSMAREEKRTAEQLIDSLSVQICVQCAEPQYLSITPAVRCPCGGALAVVRDPQARKALLAFRSGRAMRPSPE